MPTPATLDATESQGRRQLFLLHSGLRHPTLTCIGSSARSGGCTTTGVLASRIVLPSLLVKTPLREVDQRVYSSAASSARLTVLTYCFVSFSVFCVFFNPEIPASVVLLGLMFLSIPSSI